MKVNNIEDAGVGAGCDTKLVGASQLLGSAVQNRAGENLGEIKEVVMDASSGEISYAVLSFGGGGFFGLRTKFFAVPWSALTLDAEQGLVVLQVEKDRLELAPGFDKKRWPTMVENLSWWQEMQTYYRHNF